MDHSLILRLFIALVQSDRPFEWKSHKHEQHKSWRNHGLPKLNIWEAQFFVAVVYVICICTSVCMGWGGGGEIEPKIVKNYAWILIKIAYLNSSGGSFVLWFSSGFVGFPSSNSSTVFALKFWNKQWNYSSVERQQIHYKTIQNMKETPLGFRKASFINKN